MLLAGNTKLSIPIPTGYIGVSPQITPSNVGTWYNATDNFWVTYQTITAGATNLAAITFLTTGVVQLPANAVVRLPESSRLLNPWAV